MGVIDKLKELKDRPKYGADVQRDYSKGVAIYRRRPTDRELDLRDKNNPGNREDIKLLQQALKKELQIRKAQRAVMYVHKGNTPNAPVYKGKEKKAFEYDMKQTTRNIADIQSKLREFGIKVSIDGYKAKYKPLKEGGESDMVYDERKFREMKLETYQESAAGRISPAAKTYLLNYLDVMIESSKCEDVNDLAMDYIDACKEDDDDKKEEIKGKIEKIKDCAKSKEKLEELKEDLSDEEKKFMEELDEEICGKKKCDKDDEDEEGEECTEAGMDSTSGPGPDNTKDDATKTDVANKAKKAADSAGKDNKDAFENLLSAASESTLSDISKNALLDYITESVAEGEMDADQALFLSDLIKY